VVLDILFPRLCPQLPPFVLGTLLGINSKFKKTKTKLYFIDFDG